MSAERRLRQVLAADALASAISAGAALALVDLLADLMDVPTGVVLGAVVVMVDRALIAGGLTRARSATLARHAPLLAAANAVWVLASVGLLASGVIDRSAWWMIVPTSIIVAELTVAQWRFARSMRDPAAAPSIAVA